jgi:hypothetical protein
MILIVSMDYKYFSLKRVNNHSWEPYRGKDFVNTGIDVFSSTMYSQHGDTLIFKSGKKFIVKYCIFGSLWIRDFDRTYSARYIHTMSSKDW